MKRRDDNRQLRPEEVEALNEVSEEAGSFTRASSEVLAARRIVKSKRTSLPSSDAPSGLNPFAAFGSLAGTASTNAPAKPNPFANLTGLKSANSKANAKAPEWTTGMEGTKSPIKQKPASFETERKEPAKGTGVGSFGGLKQEGAAASAPPSNTSCDANSKIQRLNKSFVNWMDRQIVEHPVSVWTAGLQDYLKYADMISANTPAMTNATSGTSTEKAEPVSVPTGNGTTGAPPPAKPSFGFLSSSTKNSTAPAPATAPPAAPAPAPTKAVFGGFKGFGGGSNAASTTPATTMKSFGLPTASSMSGTTDGSKEEEEDEAEPILEPEEVLKNSTDTDEILYETKCKLFRYSKDTKEWKENGKGVLRVTVEPGQSVKRVLIRNTLGKITVNANICKGMNFKKSGKNGIQFMTVNEEGSLTAYMAKVRVETLEETLQLLTKAESEAS